MNFSPLFPFSRFAVATAAALAALVTAVPLAAQADRLTLAADAAANTVPAVRNATETNALDKGRYAVLIDLDANRLYFKQGDLTLWSAPVGTGTQVRLITHDDDWKFTTPTGRFQVQYKERDPVWIAPDWFFVENNLPVPPMDDKSRYMKGTLGAAAVYISADLAIHGTDRPELVGQRVSHGCIRLENRYAMRLFNSVQVGTEVIIVGGEDVQKATKTVDLRQGYDSSLASKGRKSAPAVNEVLEGWKKLPTWELLDVLAEQLMEKESESRWDEVAGIVLDRARIGDDRALEGLFERSLDLPSRKTEREFATLLAEAYRSSSLRSLEVLSDIRLSQRRQVANLIVSGTLTLYHGEFDETATPWPTARIPKALLSRDSRRGWDALIEAEREHREEATVVQI